MSSSKKIASIALAIFLTLGFSTSSLAQLIALDSFAQLPKISDVELSPDGMHIAYFRPLKGRKHLVLQSLSGGTPQVIPPQGDLDFEWIHWANTERLIFSISFEGVRDRVETHESRLGSISKDGQELELIIKPMGRVTSGMTVKSGSSSKAQARHPQIQDRITNWLADDPDHILVSVDENFDGEHEVRKVNVYTGDYINIRHGTKGVQSWSADYAGKVRMGWGYDDSEFVVRILGAQNEWVKAHRTTWWEQGFRPVSVTDDPTVIYVSGPSASGMSVIKKMNPFDGSFSGTVFDNPEFDATGLTIDTSTGKPVGVIHSGGVEYLDETYRILQRSIEKAHAGKIVRMVSMSADKKKIIVLATAANDPGVYFLWDRQAKKMDPIAEVMPGLDPKYLATPKAIKYDARDGLEIPGFLTTPVGVEAKNLPTVVLPHGGPHSRTTGDFWYLSQFLASRGYAVLQPNFRGSTGYGDDFQEAGKNQWGGLMQDDVTDGAKWLVDQGIADPSKMCIVGWSYGGYAAAMGAVKTPDLFNCAASINGVLDLPRLIKDDKKYIGGSSWVKSIGLEGEKSKQVSPFHQAARIKIPMLIIQARDDVRVHEDQADRMTKQLKKMGKPVELIKVDLGGHSMDNSQARKTLLSSLEKFLATHIAK